MLYGEIISVCSESRTKHTNTICGQQEAFFWRVHEIVTISVVISILRLPVRLSGRGNPAPTGRVFVNFDIRHFFENLPEKKSTLYKTRQEKRSLVSPHL